MTTQPGKYIVIEGHDGTGKSTQVGHIRTLLKERGIDSIEFHEPEGTPISSAIRTVIKNGTLERDGTTNLLLFSAARHSLWTTLALPALAAGVWVVASRNYYSTLSYQGYGEGLDLASIETITKIATGERYMKPDSAIILDLASSKERERRIAHRGELEHPDTFESKDTLFQQRVRDGYLAIAQSHNLPIVSASQSIDEVTGDVWSIVAATIDAVR